ncbi:hypothetical protein THRCLA_23479 [Thraustotheca clavata]|uniref:Uncharacterized protein n=1 Tax=Thraustotheca clavata TaxID=74557 RepID=A0A1V9Y468_9STRA|nr:hypothetical protein THRCLA_23479 [Thraustotheca clavata]
MSHKLCATRSPLPPAADERVHVLPCKIKHDGKAPISSYFIVEGNTARYRGVDLTCDQVNVNALGYTGLIMVDDGVKDESAQDDFNPMASEETTDTASIWEIDGQFATLLDWQTKELPSHESIAKRLQEWNRISAAV